MPQPPAIAPKEIVAWLKTMLNGNNGFAIIDGENLMNHPSQYLTYYYSNCMSDCMKYRLRPMIVSKSHHITRLKSRLEGCIVPDDIIYFCLHSPNETFSDDAFMIELFKSLADEKINSVIFTLDNFSNRQSWNKHKLTAMFSFNMAPKRPRSFKDEGVIIYKPNMDQIITTQVIIIPFKLVSVGQKQPRTDYVDEIEPDASRPRIEVV
jgi:hypothetical protein